MEPGRRPAPDLPRYPLLDGPSPLHPLERFGDGLGGRVEIWIKREDLLPLAFGGNKLRNLEYLVAAALADGADTLITAGRRWSNHCRLTAAAGARAGLDVQLVLCGPPLEPPGPNQRLDELLEPPSTSPRRRIARTREAWWSVSRRTSGRQGDDRMSSASGAAASVRSARCSRRSSGRDQLEAFASRPRSSCRRRPVGRRRAYCRPRGGSRRRVIGVVVARPATSSPSRRRDRGDAGRDARRRGAAARPTSRSTPSQLGGGYGVRRPPR